MATIQIIKSNGLDRIEGSVPKWITDDCHSQFTKATTRFSESTDYFIRIGNQNVRLEFAGDSLVPYFFPALKHLSQEEREFDLTIRLWDSKSSAVGMPTSIVDAPAFQNSNIGEVRLMQLLDIESATAYYWVSNPSTIPYYERGSPFRAIFQWWMEGKGIHILHAAGLGIGGDGILIAGKGGIGKSTTTLTALQSGFSYLGDDNCLVSLDPEPTIHSMYNTVKLNWNNVKNFTDLHEPLENESEVQLEKALFFVEQFKSECLVESLPLRAILTPTIVAREESGITKAKPMDMLKMLAPSTIFQSPSSGSLVLPFLSKLVQKIPVYRLELGSSKTHLIETLRQFVSEKGNHE